MPINKKVLFTIIIYLLVLIFGGYSYIHQHVEELKAVKYNALALKMQESAESLIVEKEKENVLISLSLSLNENIKRALIQQDNTQLGFVPMIQAISKYTEIDDIWIQLITAEGKSFYRSWTTRTGDDLLDIRPDVVQLLKTKKMNSFISTGKFSITFKAMIPIFNAQEFIGIIESIVKFDSIVSSLREKGYESILFVDKRYKKQLTNASEKMFIDDYFLATSNISEKLLNIVKENKVKHYLKIKNYQIDETNGLFFTTTNIASMTGQDMGHFILAYPLDAIDMSSVVQERNNILFSMLLFIILLLAFVYYIYTVQYKRFIENQNNILVDKVKEKTKSLQHIALHDSLTDLPNRILLLKILKNDLREVKENEQCLCVLFLDLDRFKEVNDTFGHSVGDKLLKQVSTRLKGSIREQDTVARVSGDEFVVILKNTIREDAIGLIDRIMVDIQEPFNIEKLELFTNFSIGISHYPTDASTAKLLLRQADTAMYKAKEKGKKNYQFYNSEMTQEILVRQGLGRDLRKALINNEFEVYYQPKIDVLSGNVIGLESLIRWQHPKKGILYPDEFIFLAEEIGLIIEIDEYIREHAFKQIVMWQKEGINTGVLSLNISTRQLESDEFLPRLNQSIRDIGIDVDFIEIEVLENQIMKDIDRGIEILESIKSLGIKISIDDFGTGYSSLSYLQRLPIDILKIDRSFIHNLLEDQSSIEIVRTIISLAKNLNLDVIAEGVETKEQYECLLEEGCVAMQGYYFTEPLSAEACKTFLLKR